MSRRALLTIVCVALGCRQVDVIADRRGTADAGSAALDGGRPGVGGAPQDFCAGGGPVVRIGGGRCAGDLAKRAFRFAVCVCEGLVTSGGIDTDSFDSREGPYLASAESTGGGAVGVNGRVDLNAPSRIDGALWAGDATGIVAGSGGQLSIERDLLCAGPLASEAGVVARRDARIAGGVRASSLVVMGTLTVPGGAPIEVSGAQQVGQLARAPVSVPAPCDCRDEVLVDIGALVAPRAFDHDDARAGLTPTALRGVDGLVTLPCGRYFFEGISTEGDLRLEATGRVAIFVSGDVAVGGTLQVRLAAGAELDLLISGQLVSAGPLDLGAQETPSRVRVYVGGRGTVQLSGGGTLGGNLYAPRAEVVSSEPVEVFGSVFARRLALSDRLTVHFDRAVQAAADDCPPPTDAACDTCRDCREGACVDGACRPCGRDADCCAPLVCVQGRCLVEP